MQNAMHTVHASQEEGGYHHYVGQSPERTPSRLGGPLEVSKPRSFETEMSHSGPLAG